VKSIKVNFGTKNATIEFDEAVISAQEIARALADTPHMMGGNMQYGGSLTLSVAGLKDDATGKKAKDALGKVEGVSKVTAFPKQESVSVEFSGKGKVTSKQLIEALDKAGLKGSHFGSGDAKKTSAARPAGEHEGMASMRMNVKRRTCPIS
jgi:copper chaperone CopZ